MAVSTDVLILSQTPCTVKSFEGAYMEELGRHEREGRKLTRPGEQLEKPFLSILLRPLVHLSHKKGRDVCWPFQAAARVAAGWRLPL
jgi:hypothetical protein